MKTIYTAMLMLLCWTGMLAQEHEYVPMLREDLIWVGKFNEGSVYYIKVKGDTLIRDVVYKKCYRYRSDGMYSQYLFPDANPISYYFTDPYTPVSCMREENGRVFRLCDKNEEHVLSFMSVDENYTAPHFNETENHYEVLVYDFDQPNIYGFQNYYETELEYCGEVMIEGTSRRVFTNSSSSSNRVLVEGLGMLGGGQSGSDLLEPCRARGNKPKMPIDLSVWYVRNASGDVLYRHDYPGPTEYDDLGEDEPRFLGEPYDFDDDNQFDISDLNAMINIMLGLRDDFIDKSADLNFDQMVDIEDMNLVINRMVSGVQPVKYSDLLKPKSE